jgi:hypothetical protein
MWLKGTLKTIKTHTSTKVVDIISSLSDLFFCVQTFREVHSDKDLVMSM